MIVGVHPMDPSDDHETRPDVLFSNVLRTRRMQPAGYPYEQAQAPLLASALHEHFGQAVLRHTQSRWWPKRRTNTTTPGLARGDLAHTHYHRHWRKEAEDDGSLSRIRLLWHGTWSEEEHDSRQKPKERKTLTRRAV